MKLSSLFLFTLPLLTSCSDGGGAAATTVLNNMLDCRRSFDTSFDTIGNMSKNLTAQQKLEALVAAGAARDRCEEKAFAPLRK